MRRTRSRRRAEAFQRSLERYERALARGTDPEEARREIAASLGEDARLLSLAVGMSAASAPIPEPRSAELFAARLRSAQIRRRRPRVVVRQRSFGLAPLALAACTVFIAALLVPSLRSLPGDQLYPVKSAAEDARVWFASGPAEARIRLGLARARFSEVERLVERGRIQAAATTLRSSNLESLAAGTDVDDPELAHLIEITLAEAGQHIEAAAKILTTHAVPASDLDALVAISKRGRALAAKVADELPTLDQPGVLDTGVKLARIEASAKAARMKSQTEPTPGPCATPTPSPEPADTPDGGADDNATTTAVESPSPEPTTRPESTPCISPSPSPTPTPTAEPVPTPEPEPESPPPATDNGAASDGEGDVGSADASGGGAGTDA